ncbi:hypothetical protein BDZ97DRAFT_1186741 [Flammula alnicola]|nr:hypothetical protein BDZ97DRAFT_1186741 [Flammula alnicola]
MDTNRTLTSVPFGVTYKKIGTIQRRLAWPLHKDDTLSRSGRFTDLNIYFAHPAETNIFFCELTLTKYANPSSFY